MCIIYSIVILVIYGVRGYNDFLIYMRIYIAIVYMNASALAVYYSCVCALQQTSRTSLLAIPHNR